MLDGYTVVAEDIVQMETGTHIDTLALRHVRLYRAKK